MNEYTSKSTDLVNISLVVNSSTNGPPTRQCSESFPTLQIYIQDLVENPVELVFTVLCMIASVVTILLFTSEAFSPHYRYKDPGKRLGTLVVLGIYPMTASMACIAVIIPRATLLTDLLSACYLALCMYVFIRLLILYYGNTECMVDVLQDQTVSLRSPPCCCCCCCLPAINFNRHNVTIMKALVFQAVCIQPALYFLQAVLWANDNSILTQGGLKAVITYLNMFIVTSIMLAIYGLQFFVRASIHKLDKHKIRYKMMVLQFVLLFSNLQNAIFKSILVKFGIPECKGNWGTTYRASMLQHMLMVFEMLLLGILARIIYRKSEFRNLSQIDDGLIYEGTDTSNNLTPIKCNDKS